MHVVDGAFYFASHHNLRESKLKINSPPQRLGTIKRLLSFNREPHQFLAIGSESIQNDYQAVQ